MFNFIPSNNIFLIAILGGFFCALFTTAFDDLCQTFFYKKNTTNREKIIPYYISSVCLGGIILGLIFSYLVYSDPEPIKMIFTYSAFWVTTLILANLLTFTYDRLFSKQKKS